MICSLCPHNCGALRTETHGGGSCAMPSLPVVAKAMLHQWEEPCLTGERGAGAVFFSGCALRCRFCQNAPISRKGFGRTVSVSRLREIFRELTAQGAACLDLVTPSHFTPAVREALGDIRWGVPVVWNSSAYERPETLRTLEGSIQVYLPDLKYAVPDLARRCSGAEDYFAWAAPAIQEMFRQTGPYRIENGTLRSGVLIRHLVLPGELENTRRVIDWVARTFRPGDVLFSLMSQYTPPGELPGAAGTDKAETDAAERDTAEKDTAQSDGLPRSLSRRLTGAEYRAAVRYMENCGITDGYVQERSAARTAYTPSFDLSGV